MDAHDFVDLKKTNLLHKEIDPETGKPFEGKKFEEKFEEQQQMLSSFSTGDAVKFNTKIKEGERERTQIFEGLVIRKRGNGPGATFTVRRISNQIGVERTFQLHSPLVQDINVVRKGRVRRSRLYYIRERTGRAAKIKEARSFS